MNNIMILKSGLEVIEIGAIRKLECGSYSPFIVTMAVSVAFVRYLAPKSGVTLKTGLGFVQGHWKWHHLIVSIRLPSRLP